MRKLARELSRAGGLRAGLSIAEAADVIRPTYSSELYVLLTVERGWSPRRYEPWPADTYLLHGETVAVPGPAARGALGRARRGLTPACSRRS